MGSKQPAFTVARSDYDAVLFDLDGVVTKTAKVHAASWKKLFDAYLEERAAREGKPFEPFEIETDYQQYVDGKPRYEGVKSFLESRGIELPYGDPDDPPDQETICGLGNRKNLIFNKNLQTHGVEFYEHAVELVRRLNTKGFGTAVVSSSKNCAAVVEAAGIADLFDARVDGIVLAELGLAGKPAPDIFLEAARRLGVEPRRAVVLEDAVSGVQAGKRGNFGWVIGVDRTGHGRALRDNGADTVVSDLADIGVEREASAPGKNLEALPSALQSLEEIEQMAGGKRLAVFLDYDGTLTPIVERPDLAVLSDEMRGTVSELANHCSVAVISGRDRRDVEQLVGIDNIFYAGSHGFDISGPSDQHIESQQGSDFLPVIERAEGELRDRLEGIDGALVERKKFSIAVHYRQVEEGEVERVERAVDEVLSAHEELRKGYGKKVFELQPKIDWHKGKALLWLLEALKLDEADVLPLYLGDDITDEDAFKVLQRRGIGIVVKDGDPETGRRQTAARYSLENPDEVREFLQALTLLLKGESR